jgi:hypothetical protein
MTKKKNNKDKRYTIQIYFANKLMSLDFEFDNYIEFTDFIKNVDFAMRK